MIVMKFGGSSIADSERIKNVASIIASEKWKRPLVVISGIRGITDELISIGRSASSGKEYISLCNKAINRHMEIIRRLELKDSLLEDEIRLLMALTKEISKNRTFSRKKLDLLMSLGERMSVKILAEYMNRNGHDAIPCNSYEIGVLTDSNFGNADILPGTYERIRKSLKGMDSIPIITGFIGMDRKGSITTLGRGGSDYTACIVGAAMNVDEIQIWTNVNGIMTADPKLVPLAKSITELTFDEEAELEFLGAETLHPRGIHPAMEGNINVRIMNTLNRRYRGSLIRKEIKASKRVASITSKKGMVLFKMPSEENMREGFNLSLAISKLGRLGISFDFVSISRSGIVATTTKGEELAELIGNDEEAAEKLKVLGKVAKVSVVGKNISDIKGIDRRIMKALGNIGIIMLDSGVSRESLSVVLDEKAADRATVLLHNEFFGRSG